jgi:hypothetical protein
MDRMPLTKCFRCNGAMAYDKFYSPYGEYWGWKCLICGDIVDPVILNNRQSMIAGQEIAVRRLKRY